MEASARGALEAGGHTIGVTCDRWGRQANRFIRQVVPAADLAERLQHLADLASAGFVILPGSTGTLLELAWVWEHIFKRMSPRRPDRLPRGFLAPAGGSDGPLRAGAVNSWRWPGRWTTCRPISPRGAAPRALARRRRWSKIARRVDNRHGHRGPTPRTPRPRGAIIRNQTWTIRRTAAGAALAATAIFAAMAGALAAAPPMGGRAEDANPPATSRWTCPPATWGRRSRGCCWKSPPCPSRCPRTRSPPFCTAACPSRAPWWLTGCAGSGTTTRPVRGS